MVAVPTPVEIFCSYASADEVWLRKLETHLILLKRQGLISFWYDRLIAPGTEWTKTIDSQLETASIILLLVSADFFASDYCYGIEMQRALARQKAGEVRVVPILARPVNWKDAPFAHLQLLPTDRKPLSTWQDEDTALADVAAGIRRALEDLTLLAASAPRAALPAIWNIPYQRNPFFLGRENKLAQMRQQLQADQTTILSQPQAISGLGGIGKTQLALEYAYRYHQHYTAVLWARAESAEALVSSYVTIASLLRLPEREAQEQDITVKAVKIWLQMHRGWLLILDNADELTLLPDFLPPTLGGHLLLTTRAAATGRLAHRLEVGTLLPEQAALFLLRRAGFLASDAPLERATLGEQHLARQIAEELGELPLALNQAGAYIEETGTSLAGYLRIYQMHRSNLLKMRGRLEVDHPESVVTTWALSFQKVTEKEPATADLLCLCAFLAPDAIPEEIFTKGAPFLGSSLSQIASDDFLLNQTFEALRAYSLIHRDPRRQMLSIHRLMQVVLQDQLSETEKHLWAERAIFAVNTAFPHVEHGTWLQCERLLSQAWAGAQNIERYQMTSEGAGRLLYEMASYLQDRARYIEAEPLYQRALHIREQHLGPEHPEAAYTLNALAVLYWQQGKYGEAEQLYQRALHIWELLLGPEDPQVAVLLDNLALLYFDQGKYAEAEQLYQQALRIQEQHLGPEHSQLVYSLNGLANLYSDQEKYAEAERFHQRALRIQEQHLGLEHPQVAYSLDGLANLYSDQRKYTKAEQLYQRALRIREEHLGEEHPEVAYSLNALANLSRKQGKYAEAESLFQRALRIREQALGSKHSETAETIHDLARFWEKQGHNEEARDWYVRAQAVREQALGVHHPKTTETRNRLITLLHTMERHEEAAQLEAIQPES